MATPAATATRRPSTPIDATAAVTLTMIFWSGTVIANRAAVAHVDALSAGAGRSLVAAVIGLTLALTFRLPFPARARGRLTLVYAGWINFAIWPAMLSIGIGLANATHAALIMALIPVFTTLFAAVLERKKLASAWWLGAAVAVGGTVLLILFTNPSENLTLSPRYLVGDLIIVAGVALCASGYVASARLSPEIGSWGSTFWGLGAALLILVPTLAITWDRTDWALVPASSWAGLAWMAFLSSLAGYALWFYAMQRGGIARIAAWQFGQPVLSLIAATLLLAEPVTWPVAAAAMAVVGGTVIAHRFAP